VSTPVDDASVYDFLDNLAAAFGVGRAQKRAKTSHRAERAPLARRDRSRRDQKRQAEEDGSIAATVAVSHGRIVH
jgi:hypothetical protein